MNTSVYKYKEEAEQNISLQDADYRQKRTEMLIDITSKQHKSIIMRHISMYGVMTHNNINNNNN